MQPQLQVLSYALALCTHFWRISSRDSRYALTFWGSFLEIVNFGGSILRNLKMHTRLMILSRNSRHATTFGSSVLEDNIKHPDLDVLT